MPLTHIKVLQLFTEEALIIDSQCTLVNRNMEQAMKKSTGLHRQSWRKKSVSWCRAATAVCIYDLCGL